MVFIDPLLLQSSNHSHHTYRRHSRWVPQSRILLEFSDCNFSIRGKIQRGFGKVIKEQAHTTNAIRLYGTRLSLPIASRLTAMVPTCCAACVTRCQGATRWVNTWRRGYLLTWGREHGRSMPTTKDTLDNPQRYYRYCLGGVLGVNRAVNGKVYFPFTLLYKQIALLDGGKQKICSSVWVSKVRLTRWLQFKPIAFNKGVLKHGWRKEIVMLCSLKVYFLTRWLCYCSWRNKLIPPWFALTFVLSCDLNYLFCCVYCSDVIAH